MMQARGRSLPAALLLSGLCVANPATLAGLRIGHPEEPLAAALVVLAVLVARERPMVAGVLTGLAIGTKQWALAALPVVLMLAARRRPALILAAGAVAACLLVPGPLVDRGAAADARRQVLDTHTVNVVSAWWPLARDRRAGGTVTAHVLPGGLTRTDVAAAVVLVALLLSLELARRGGFEGDGATERALALLGLVLLLRCALDPGNLEYYGVGALLALCAWEGLARAGPPLITPLAMVANWALFGPITGLDDTRITIAFLGLNLCFGLYLALASFAPGRLQRPAAAQL
jgi:Glycosyltransferase family 87